MDFPEASRAHDQIFLVLPDGREVIGKALIVQDPVHVTGSGDLTSNFALLPGTPPMDVCVVLMKLDVPVRPRIILG